MNTTAINRFDAHADEYDAHARVQARSAGMLCERLRMFLGEEPVTRIVELGCGTGFLTRRLATHFPGATIRACDTSPAMVAKTRAALRKTFGDDARFSIEERDGEFAEFSEPVDVIASNLCMQWFPRQLDAIAHHARRTRFLALTTLVEGTFASWIAACERHAQPHGVQPFVTVAALEAVRASIPGRRSVLHVDTIDEAFPNALAFLRDLRALGATTSPRQHRPASLHAVMRSCADGFTAEYRVATMLIETTNSCASS